MDDWDLDALLHPVALDHFDRTYWQREVLHVIRDDHRLYSGLVDAATVDDLVAAFGGRDDFPISLLGGARADRQAQAQRPPPRRHWTRERVMQRHAAGATIRIGNMADYVPAVRRMTSCLEAQLSADVFVNLYQTPPASHAFGAHFDKHDVFVLQIEGAKTWRIFSPPQLLPLEVTDPGRAAWVATPLPDARDALATPTVKSIRTYRLQAGDLLYVPRGYLHQVQTEDERSLHLTIAVVAVTWYEVAVQSLLAVAHRTPALRAALPIGFATHQYANDQASRQVDGVVATLHRQLGAADLRSALGALAEQFIYSRNVEGCGSRHDVARIHDITPNTWLKISAPLLYTTRISARGMLLLFGGRSVKVPARAESMLEYILQHRVFRVAQLPTSLSDASRLTLVRALTTQGFLTFVDTGSP